MTFDAGRIRHDASLMHYSRMSNGSSVPSNWRLSATGDTGVIWAPESATSVSYGSNSNDVSTSSAGGASSLAARTDHTHRGVRSVSVSSNTLLGDVTLLAQGSVGLTVSGQTIAVNVAPVTGGGASVSYGSNSNQVSYANAPGVSSLVSRADHVHLGVTSVSHASNTFSGPVILTASGSLGITVPTPGTFNLSAVAGSGSGGSGSGVTHAYAGYNSIGGSTENALSLRQYMKKVTISADCLISSVGMYIKQITAGEIMSFAVGILSDVAGDPTLVLAANELGGTGVGQGLFLSTANGSAGAARWVHLAVGLYVTAGDYWLAAMIQLPSANSHQVYFDGSGGDRYYTNGGHRITDSGWTAVTTTTNRYSLRASTIR